MTRAKGLAILLAAQGRIFGPDHPVTRATAARMNAASGYCPPADVAAYTAYRRELGTAGFRNRSWRRNFE